MSGGGRNGAVSDHLPEDADRPFIVKLFTMKGLSE